MTEEKKLIATSKSGNKYLFSENTKNFFYLPVEFEEVLRDSPNLSSGKHEYYRKKYHFLKEGGIFEPDEHDFSTHISAKSIKVNIANSRQFLIEVTDKCNLNCKYCGYGLLYSNYDERNRCEQSFHRVRLMIDYLVELWKSPLNISHNNTFFIGFYGGEPLLNVELIKKTVSYFESLELKNIHLQYNITTNGLLLDKFMDFLEQKKFRTLISLDGNKYHNSYRVTKQGKESFEKIISNVESIRNKYPEYYKEYVNFNAVLHNRNSFGEVFDFIFETFGKEPRIAELNTNAIAAGKENEFYEMFLSKNESYKTSAFVNKPENDLLNDSRTVIFDEFINCYSGNSFNSYTDLFFHKKDKRYIPTGTCLPFQRKIFLTVNGKILPCEKIGHDLPLGYVSDDKIEIDADQVASLYSEMYSNVVDQCRSCSSWRNCGHCIYYMRKENEKTRCQYYSKNNHNSFYFGNNISYAEENPALYEKLYNEVLKD